MRRLLCAVALLASCSRPAEVRPVPSEPQRVVPPGPLCASSATALRLDTSEGALVVDQAEMTQADWQSLTGTTPSLFDGCPDCPVERVSFADVAAVLNRRSIRAKLPPCYTIDRSRCTRDDAGCPQDKPYCVAPCVAPVTQTRAADQCGFRVPTRVEWAEIERTALSAMATTPSNGATRSVVRGAALDGVHGNVWEWLAPAEAGGVIAGGGWTTSPEGPFDAQSVDLRVRSSNIGVRGVRSCSGP